MQPSSLEQVSAGLVDLLRDGLAQAANQASQQPERFTRIVSQAVDDAGSQARELAELPGSLWDRLRQAAEHPDWLSLMILLALKLRDAVGDPPLKVGACDPGDGWSRSLVLTLTQPLPDGAAAELTLMIALGGEGTNGVIVHVAHAPRFDLAPGPLRVQVSAVGDGDWRFPIGGPVAMPAAGATLALDLGLTHDLVPDTGGPIALGVGAPHLTASLKHGTGASPEWSAALALGQGDANGGLRARFDLTQTLGALTSVVQVEPVDERYSPAFRFSSAAAPVFDVGRSSP